jgi:hypothetical protein
MQFEVCRDEFCFQGGKVKDFNLNPEGDTTLVLIKQSDLKLVDFQVKFLSLQKEAQMSEKYFKMF